MAVVPRVIGCRPLVSALRLAGLGLLLFWLTPLTSARQQAPQKEVHRIPAESMTFLGADWLERDARATQEQPEQMLDALGLKPGDVVADIGCGTGYLARRLVRRVMPLGKVYCNEIQPEMLQLMIHLAAKEGVSGIEAIVGDADDPKLPVGKIDWILLSDVYHEMSDPQAMLAKMRQALAPNGRIALVEYRVEDGTSEVIKPDHLMSVREVLREWKPAGYELIDLKESLPRQHLFVFRPSGGRGPATDVIEDYDLLDAIAQKRVDVQAIGAGGEKVTIRIKRNSGRRMVITAPVGLYFKASGSSRDMIARRDSAIALVDDEVKEWTIRAVGRQDDKPEPAPTDRLDIRSPSTAPKLAELMRAIQLGTYITGGSPTLYPPRTYKLEQTAVWIAEHDLRYYELAAFAAEPRIPAQYSVAFALVFLDQAGFDVKTRRVWMDRGQVFDKLQNRGLATWYDSKVAPIYPPTPLGIIPN